MGRIQEVREVVERSVAGVDVVILGDVVSVIAQRRRIEREQPDSLDAELAQVVQSRSQADEVADPVAVRVGEGTDMHFVNDGVAVPVW